MQPRSRAPHGCKLEALPSSGRRRRVGELQRTHHGCRTRRRRRPLSQPYPRASWLYGLTNSPSMRRLPNSWSAKLRTFDTGGSENLAGLRAALERHGGTVEKFIGDAVVAVFGAPIAHEDDPERAVRAGLAILDEIEGLNEEDPTRRLEVQVGINTGEALVALAARVSEGQGMAWGDVM